MKAVDVASLHGQDLQLSDPDLLPHEVLRKPPKAQALEDRLLLRAEVVQLNGGAALQWPRAQLKSRVRTSHGDQHVFGQLLLRDGLATSLTRQRVSPMRHQQRSQLGQFP